MYFNFSRRTIMIITTMDTVTWIWLIAGLGLLATELFLPGLIVGFFGLGAIIVAGLRWVGLLSGFGECVLTWVASSTVLILMARRALARRFPSETSYQVVDEDVDAAGSIVEVIQTVNSFDNTGRIRYGGTTWPATVKEGTILSGQRARLLYRDNLAWVVEPYGNEKTVDLEKE